MQARPGDMLVVRGHKVGETERIAEVLEVHGKDGGPPFLVRWQSDGQEGVLFPGSDVVIKPRTKADRTG